VYTLNITNCSKQAEPLAITVLELLLQLAKGEVEVGLATT